jgi:hypothetical protein
MKHLHAQETSCALGLRSKRSTMKPEVVMAFLIVIEVCLSLALDKPVNLCTPGSVEALFTNC